jgi:thiamine biosynthesis lipoprotein
VTTPTVTFAALGGWSRHVHIEQVWGTVVTFDVRAAEDSQDAGGFGPAAALAVAEAVEFLHDVDAWFSTYRVDTPVTALRNGLLDMDDMPPVVQGVLDDCWRLRVLTEGVFDPWSVPGGVDPSGYVKGWAADVAADIVVDRGFPNVSVNAAGDVTCRGHQSPDQPWVVGIRHPAHADQIVRTVAAVDEAVATSGCYERGAHVHDPRRGVAAVALDSATVVGPDGGMADALATALLVAGPDGAGWFAELPGWSAYLVSGDQATYFGPAFA